MRPKCRLCGVRHWEREGHAFVANVATNMANKVENGADSGIIVANSTNGGMANTKCEVATMRGRRAE